MSEKARSDDQQAAAQTPVSRPGSRLAPGDVVGGHYAVEELLGEGGMAVVYRGRNTATGKACALKILHAQLGARPEFMRLFAKEAKVGSVIGESEHIVAVFDAGLDEARGLPFIVMELCEGETLEHALERGPLPEGEAQAVLRQLGAALAQAHRAGVVHRDLKPSNLFLARDAAGKPLLKVMDFGIAKVLEEGAVRTATQIGTPAYTAPEQMGPTTRKLAAKQGINIARGVSPATDVWAVGLIAYELLTGQRPGQYWAIDTMTELPMKVAFEPIESASARAGDRAGLLPAGFDLWFERCLRKNAAERWPDAAEAVAALLALAPGAPAPGLRTAPMPESKLTVAAAPASAAAASPADAALPPSCTPPPSVPTEALRSPAMVVSKEVRTSSGARWRLPAVPRWGYVAAAAVAVAGLVGWLSVRGAAARAAEQGCLLGDADVGAAERAARCERACDTGSPAGCAKLGDLHDQGIGGPRDEARALQLYSRACGVVLPAAGEAGTAADTEMGRWTKEIDAEGCGGSCAGEACASLGRYFQEGRGGLARNEGAATALFKRACQEGAGAASPRRGTAGCVGLGQQRERAGEHDAARSYYRAACDGGVAAGCVSLGRLLERGGPGAERDDKGARALYRRACDDGEQGGCVRLGHMVEQGRGGWVADERAAVAIYERACAGGEQRGCVALGHAQLGGRGGLPRDAVRAAELFVRACDAGSLAGCAELGALYARGQGGLERDEKRAFALSQRACDGGEMRGCANLGGMYLSGAAGLSKDDKEARRLLERACRGGDGGGCLRLARLGGDAGSKADPELVAVVGQACEEGEQGACVGLGDMIETGRDGAKQPDVARAAELYRRACEAGTVRGCTNLANLAYQGLGGLEKSPERSFSLNEQACRGGDGVGCARLGLLYALGQGTAKDLRRAAELHRAACVDPEEPTPEMKERCAWLAELVAADAAGR